MKRALRLLVALFVGVGGSTVSAVEFYYRPDGDSGMFETPANWFVGNTAQDTAYPGEDDAICCTNGLKTVCFAEPGTTHRVKSVSLNKGNYVNNQQLFVDLNGGTLCVTGAVEMKASRYEGVVRPYFGITNGTLLAEKGIGCGGTDNNYRGRFEAFGPDTHIVIGGGNLSANGAGSLVDIGGGASVIWTGMGAPTLCTGEGSTYAGEGNIVKMNITGEGTVLSGTNGFSVVVNSRMRVANKARVVLSGFASAGAWGRKDRSSVGSDFGGKTSTCAELEIDDATFCVTNGAHVMVAEANGCSLYNNRLTVKNGGLFNFSGNTSLTLGYIQSGTGHYQETTKATNNWLCVYSGGRITSEGTTVNSEWATSEGCPGAIVVGIGVNCFDNGIHVSNGVISVTHITLGSAASCSNNWLRIEGREGRVLLNQKYAASGNLPNNRNNPALGLYNNARVELVLGADGYDNPPIEMTTALGIVYGTQNADLNQKAQIIVEDRDFAKNHPGETVTLIKTMNAGNRAYLGQLVADATVLARRDVEKGTLSVSEDGKCLLYTAPAKRGTVVVVR